MPWTERELLPTAFAIMVAVQGGFGGPIGLGEHYTTLSDIRPEWRDARRSCLIEQQAVVAGLREAFLASATNRFSNCGLAHDPIGVDAVGAHRDNPGAPDMRIRCIAVSHEGSQAAAIRGLRVMEVPVRMRQTRTYRIRPGSLSGLECQA